MIRWTLERKSWRQIANVTGASSEECERRFFENWLPVTPEIGKTDLSSKATTSNLKSSISDASIAAPLSGKAKASQNRGWRNMMPWVR